MKVHLKLEVDVDFDYTPGDPGQFSGPPEHCWPAEPEEVHIYSASLFKKNSLRFPATYLPGGRIYHLDILDLLTADQTDEIERQIMAQIEADAEPDEGDR